MFRYLTILALVVVASFTCTQKSEARGFGFFFRGLFAQPQIVQAQLLVQPQLFAQPQVVLAQQNGFFFRANNGFRGAGAKARTFRFKTKAK